MKYSKWVGVISFVLIVIVSFQPWVYIASRKIIVTGMQAVGTNFGRPALLNLIIGAIALILFLIPSIMAKRANLFFCALNLAWSIRNFIILSSCRAGECPEKQAGLYIMLIASVLMVIVSLFPDVRLDEHSGEKA